MESNHHHDPTICRNIQDIARILHENLAGKINEDPGYIPIFKAFERIQGFEDHTRLYLSPSTRPVSRHWEQVLDMAEQGRLAPMAQLFRKLSPHVSWMDDPDYRGESVDEEFLRNYGCFELVGTRGIIRDDQVTLGCLLLSPEIFFPFHAHPGNELLYLMHGRGIWHMDQGQIISIPKESHILIPENQIHAFWSVGEQALAALYVCAGD